MWTAQTSTEQHQLHISSSPGIHFHITPIHSLPLSRSLPLSMTLSHTHSSCSSERHKCAQCGFNNYLSTSCADAYMCFPKIEERQDRFRFEGFLSDAWNAFLIEGGVSLDNVLVFWGKMKIVLIINTISVYSGFLFIRWFICLSIII